MAQCVTPSVMADTESQMSPMFDIKPVLELVQVQQDMEPVGILIMLNLFELFVSLDLSGVPVN